MTLSRDPPLTLITAEPEGTEVTARLEEALEEARAVRISSIAIAFVDREGVVSTLWSKPPSMGLLIGAVSQLSYRLSRALDRD